MFFDVRQRYNVRNYKLHIHSQYTYIERLKCTRAFSRTVLARLRQSRALCMHVLTNPMFLADNERHNLFSRTLSIVHTRITTLSYSELFNRFFDINRSTTQPQSKSSSFYINKEKQKKRSVTQIAEN